MIALVPLATIAPQRLEALLDSAFGPDRQTRTAYRLRADTSAVAELSLAAIDADGVLLGTIQCWPVALDCDNGESVPLVLVGPVAVNPAYQQQGIGRMLMQRMLKAVASCEAEGCDTLMLIGDPEYYGRFFGFSAEATGKWRLPGPFERHRLLARGAHIPDRPGMLGPRVQLGCASGFPYPPRGA